MKKIKIVLSLVICLFALNMAIAQSPAINNMQALDQKVGLTASQKTSVQSLYSTFFVQTENMNEAEAQSLKINLRDDINALLTAQQRARLNSRLNRIN